MKPGISMLSPCSGRVRASACVLGTTSALMLGGCGAGITGSAPPVAVSSGPQLGYAWNAKDETLRPILGVPGSSQVGQSVVPAGAYVAGAGSASGMALLVGTDQQVYRMTLPGGTPAQIGATAAPGTTIRLSPSGTAALLYVPGTTAATVVTKLSATGATVRPISLPAAIVDGAASDAGSAAAMLQTAGGVSVDLLAASGLAQPLRTIGGDGGLSFAGTSEDLLVADSAANSLTLIRTASTTPTPVALATGTLLKAPVAVAASRNENFATVANGGESSVVRIDLTGASAPLRVVCPAQPAVVAALAGNGVFRFNELGTAPVWMADVTTPHFGMLFILALSSASTAAAAAPSNPSR